MAPLPVVVPEEAVVRAVLEGEVVRYRPSREATGLERRGVSLWEMRRDGGVVGYEERRRV